MACKTTKTFIKRIKKNLRPLLQSRLCFTGNYLSHCANTFKLFTLHYNEQLCKLMNYKYYYKSAMQLGLALVM